MESAKHLDISDKNNVSTSHTKWNETGEEYERTYFDGSKEKVIPLFKVKYKKFYSDCCHEETYNNIWRAPICSKCKYICEYLKKY